VDNIQFFLKYAITPPTSTSHCHDNAMGNHNKILMPKTRTPSNSYHQIPITIVPSQANTIQQCTLLPKKHIEFYQPSPYTTCLNPTPTTFDPRHNVKKSWNTTSSIINIQPCNTTNTPTLPAHHQIPLIPIIENHAWGDLVQSEQSGGHF